MTTQPCVTGELSAIWAQFKDISDLMRCTHKEMVPFALKALNVKPGADRTLVSASEAPLTMMAAIIVIVGLRFRSGATWTIKGRTWWNKWWWIQQ